MPCSRTTLKQSGKLSKSNRGDFDEALSRLEGTDPDAAQIVKLRVFAGLSVEEAAESLGVAARSAYRDWSFAQTWLFRELRDGTA